MSRRSIDQASGKDILSVSKVGAASVKDALCESRVVWRIFRFNDDDGLVESLSRRGLSIEALAMMFPERVVSSSAFEGNVMLNEGIQAIEDLIAGLSTPTKWDNTNAYTGVGDSTTAENATQTGLLGSNKTYKGMDAGYPTRSGQTLTWRSTYGSSDANYDWNEFTVANGNSDSAINLNRKVSAQGTKQSGQTWILSVSITLS